MGNNYVLPIEQTKVTVQQAKLKQIIEETDAKAQEIIENADNKAQIITQAANTEAEGIITQARKKAESQYDEIKQQGYNEGFEKGEEDGLEKFKNDAKDAISSLDTLVSSAFNAKKNIIESATLDIVELVSAIADKVCHISFDDKILYQITLDAIKQLKEKEKITIIVNPQLVDNISGFVDTFKTEIPKLESVKIVEDNAVSPDGVIVETLSSRLDARISAQIEEITQKMLTGANDELE